MPSTGKSCVLPILPDYVSHQTANKNLLCGGTSTSDSCIEWNPEWNPYYGNWQTSFNLDVGRYSHVSWTPNSGIGTYLMGGKNSDNTPTLRTTTLIKPDGTQEDGFTLRYDTK